jgi:hypothetical protein
MGVAGDGGVELGAAIGAGEGGGLVGLGPGRAVDALGHAPHGHMLVDGAAEADRDGAAGRGRGRRGGRIGRGGRGGTGRLRLAGPGALQGRDQAERREGADVLALGAVDLPIGAGAIRAVAFLVHDGVGRGVLGVLLAQHPDDPEAGRGGHGADRVSGLADLEHQPAGAGPDGRGGRRLSARGTGG